MMALSRKPGPAHFAVLGAVQGEKEERTVVDIVLEGARSSLGRQPLHPFVIFLS
jgi:hypothetical protein